MTALRFAVLTVSDRSARGERADTSGPALAEIIASHGWKVDESLILPDELEILSRTLAALADSGWFDIILTTGGTGFAPRDVTPEATRQVVERLTPGLDEAMRAESLKKTPHAMLSRAASGIRRRTLIVNLPGSPRGAVENFQVVLPVLEHAIQLLTENPDSEKGH